MIEWIDINNNYKNFCTLNEVAQGILKATLSFLSEDMGERLFYIISEGLKNETDNIIKEYNYWNHTNLESRDVLKTTECEKQIIKKTVEALAFLSEDVKNSIIQMIEEKYGEKIKDIREKREQEEKLKSILDNIKAGRIEKDCNVLWLDWKSFTFELPEKWDFKWFKFTLCVSDDGVRTKYIDQHSTEFEKEAYSFKEIADILQALNKYLKNCWIETDWEVNYLSRMQSYYGNLMTKSIAWDCLKYLTGFGNDGKEDWFWMNNKNPQSNCQWFLWCSWDGFYFNHIGNSSCRILTHGRIKNQ